MSQGIKSQAKILQKLGIKSLNEMQKEAFAAIESNRDILLLSPTGTGKTLAFLLPIISQLQHDLQEVQAIIVVPTRELSIQIEQVIREMGSGFKANAVYGGQSFSKDRTALKHPPALLVGTPGRVADHLRRETFNTSFVNTLVLDEFDKSLEIGFDADMMDISERLKKVKKRILTSATQAVDIPNFVGFGKPAVIDYSVEKKKNLSVQLIEAHTKDKIEDLTKLLKKLGNQPGIVFCNFKDSIQKISDSLTDAGIQHGCFYGGLEQKDRERVLIQFRNGTHKVILATDLAARGLDIPELNFIVHFQLPHYEDEFTHRNGRTARMHASGTAYVLHWSKAKLPSYVKTKKFTEVAENNIVENKDKWTTIFISGGRKDKISKGDIAGFFMKQGNLTLEQIGLIELKTDCAFIAVDSKIAKKVIDKLNNTKLKSKKVRLNTI